MKTPCSSTFNSGNSRRSCSSYSFPGSVEWMRFLYLVQRNAFLSSDFSRRHCQVACLPLTTIAREGPSRRYATYSSTSPSRQNVRAWALLSTKFRVAT